MRIAISLQINRPAAYLPWSISPNQSKLKVVSWVGLSGKCFPRFMCASNTTGVRSLTFTSKKSKGLFYKSQYHGGGKKERKNVDDSNHSSPRTKKGGEWTLGEFWKIFGRDTLHFDINKSCHQRVNKHLNDTFIQMNGISTVCLSKLRPHFPTLPISPITRYGSFL